MQTFVEVTVRTQGGLNLYQERDFFFWSNLLRPIMLLMLDPYKRFIKS